MAYWKKFKMREPFQFYRIIFQWKDKKEDVDSEAIFNFNNYILLPRWPLFVKVFVSHDWGCSIYLRVRCQELISWSASCESTRNSQLTLWSIAYARSVSVPDGEAAIGNLSIPLITRIIRFWCCFWCKRKLLLPIVFKTTQNLLWRNRKCKYETFHLFKYSSVGYHATWWSMATYINISLFSLFKFT